MHVSDEITDRPDLAEIARQLPASRWHRSSFCGAAGSCVEVADLHDGAVAIRRGASTHDQVLTFTAAEWDAFLAGVKDGEFG